MKRLKRIKKGQGFSAFSVSDWELVCNCVEKTRGVGCRVEHQNDGSMIIIVDGVSTDLPFPEGTTQSSGGIPIGTEIWGRLEYDGTNHKLVQYKETWDGSAFVENNEPEATPVITYESHLSQH